MRSKISPRMIDRQEIEVDAVRLHLAGIERQHAVIEPAGESNRNIGHDPLLSPCTQMIATRGVPDHDC